MLDKSGLYREILNGYPVHITQEKLEILGKSTVIDDVRQNRGVWAVVDSIDNLFCW